MISQPGTEPQQAHVSCSQSANRRLHGSRVNDVGNVIRIHNSCRPLHMVSEGTGDMWGYGQVRQGYGSRPILSFTAPRNRCLQPNYRSVVSTETCPSRN